MKARPPCSSPPWYYDSDGWPIYRCYIYGCPSLITVPKRICSEHDRTNIYYRLYQIQWLPRWLKKWIWDRFELSESKKTVREQLARHKLGIKVKYPWS